MELNVTCDLFAYTLGWTLADECVANCGTTSDADFTAHCTALSLKVQQFV